MTGADRGLHDIPAILQDAQVYVATSLVNEDARDAVATAVEAYDWPIARMAVITGTAAAVQYADLVLPILDDQPTPEEAVARIESATGVSPALAELLAHADAAMLREAVADPTALTEQMRSIADAVGDEADMVLAAVDHANGRLAVPDFVPEDLA